MSLTNNIAIKSIGNAQDRKLIIVKGSILPPKTQTAIAIATERCLTCAPEGLKDRASGNTTTIFNNSTPYSTAFTVKRTEVDDGDRSQIIHAPLDLQLIEKLLTDNDFRKSQWHQSLDTIRGDHVAYQDLQGGIELASQLLEISRRQKTLELTKAIKQAGLNPGRMNIDFMSEGMSAVPSRRYETESIDSMLQEFSDTAVDFTETDFDHREQENRYKIQAIDYFQDDSERTSLLDEIKNKLFDGDNVKTEHIVGFYIPTQRTKGAYIEIKGTNNSKIRIEREPNSEITKVVFYINDGMLPIEISGVAGLKELMSKIESDVSPKLRELENKRKLEFVSTKIHRSLSTIDPVGMSTNLDLAELQKLLSQ